MLAGHNQKTAQSHEPNPRRRIKNAMKRRIKMTHRKVNRKDDSTRRTKQDELRGLPESLDGLERIYQSHPRHPESPESPGRSVQTRALKAKRHLQLNNWKQHFVEARAATSARAQTSTALCAFICYIICNAGRTQPKDGTKSRTKPEKTHKKTQ